MWLYFYTCKYTSIYRNKQIHLNIFNEKNKKIRKQKCNKIFILLLFNLYIYLYSYIHIKQINKIKKKSIRKEKHKKQDKNNLYLYIYIPNKILNKINRIYIYVVIYLCN